MSERVLGEYILEKLLGRGAMGQVWLSRHPGLGVPVAIKCLKPELWKQDPEYLQRFLNEGRLAASIEHPNMVRIYNAGSAGDNFYLVMEYIKGRDMSELLETSFKP